MKVFIVGLPNSGRTTISEAVCQVCGFEYIDAVSWVESTFRDPKPNESSFQYEDDYQQYLTKRMVVNSKFISDHISEMIKISNKNNTTFIIDVIASPRDFTNLFDYKKDIVVFLNRLSYDSECKDHENIAISVIREYCTWMSAANLLDKENWLEYNFRIPGEDLDQVKQMGAHNSVFIIKSIDKVISHLSSYLKRDK